VKKEGVKAVEEMEVAKEVAKAEEATVVAMGVEVKEV